MRLAKIRIGFGLTGSHCTIPEVLPEMKRLKEEGAEIFPIFSPSVAKTDTRFIKAGEVLERVRRLTGREPWVDLAEVRSEEHTSELQSRPHLVCRLLLEK